MTRASFLLGLLLAAVGVMGAAEKPGAPPGETGQATNRQVVAYYFHGTIRCEMCLKFEKQAREAIEARFPVEILQMFAGGLVADQPGLVELTGQVPLPVPHLGASA
jgi:hypothetical protein